MTSEHDGRGAEARGPYESTLAGDTAVGGLVEEFIVSLPARVRELSRAAESDDPDRLEQTLHRLVGSTACYGFPEVAECARRAERFLRNPLTRGDLPSLRAHVDEVVRAVGRIRGFGA